MKKKLAKIKQHPKYNKVLNWGKLISITGSAQIILQAVGFVSGILVIRLLPTQEYALYTLANTMLGTMTVLSDAGISTGVMAQGGRVWKDREKLGSVVATGLDLRKRFAIFSLIVSAPILLYLLLHNGATWIMAVMIVLSLIPAFYAALSDSLLEIVPKLHQSIVPLQKNQIVVSFGRLILSGLTLFVFPLTFVAILANGIPRIFGNIKLQKISEDYIDTLQKPDPAVRKDILKLVKRMLPGAIYFSLSGQITIWIISIVGNTTSIAALGALGRISVLFTIFSVLVGSLLVPRFARLENKRSELLKRYSQIIFVSFIIMFFVGGIAAFFSDKLLWVLGDNYSKFNFELILNIIIACISVISGISFSLYSSRGWVLHPLFAMIKNVIIIVTCCIVLDLSTLAGALYMNLAITLSSMLMNVIYGYYNLIRVKN